MCHGDFPLEELINCFYFLYAAMLFLRKTKTMPECRISLKEHLVSWGNVVRLGYWLSHRPLGGVLTKFGVVTTS